MPKIVTPAPGEPSVAGSTGSIFSETSICPGFAANAPWGTITVTWLSEVTGVAGLDPLGSSAIGKTPDDGGWLVAARSGGGLTQR